MDWGLFLGAVTLVTSSAAALFALLFYLHPPHAKEAMTFAQISDLVRAETERVRQAHEEQARGLRQELGERVDRGIKSIEEKTAAIAAKLDAEMAKMADEANRSRESLKAAINERLENSAARQAEAGKLLREEVAASLQRFGASNADMLNQIGVQQKERLENVGADLRALAEKQQAGQDSLRQSVENRLDAIRQENSAKLDEMRRTVDEKLQTTLEQRLGESFRAVSEHLKAVHQGLGEMQKLATGVGDLKKVLTNVKTRGTMAESLLGAQLAQFLSPEQYIQNAQCKEGSSERVEFAIRIPDPTGGEVLLPVDAKFPQEDYDRIVQSSEAGENAALDQAINAFELRIRDCAKMISEKYLNPPTTTDFALLYLPTEGLFAEVLRRPGLFDSLQRQYHVAVTGPTTLSAVLSAFQMGFRSIAINQRADEVWKLLGAVRKEFENHGAVVAKLKKQLNTASNTIDELGRRTRVMNRHLREVEFIPSQGAPDLLVLTAPEAADDEDADESAEIAAE
jgi:DNA recombination protein RmuC